MKTHPESHLCRRRLRGLGRVIALLGSIVPLQIEASDLHSFAFVQDDGTLKISGTIVHLHGIHIPETDRTCRSFERPLKCAPRAALALDFKVKGFVRCEVIERNPDRSVTASCEVDGEDLSAYMLRQGWALALPDAPFEYAALEKIARHHNLGVWGISVESPRRPPARRSLE